MSGERSATRRFAVIGHPIAHSLSPVMHRAAIAALAIDATYEPIDVAPEALAEWVAAHAPDGFNVTIPHKERIVSLLDEIDEDARAIGAVNTVSRTSDDRLVGTNTDAPGLVAALEHVSVQSSGARVLVVGAGGAARAAVVGLARAGAIGIVVAARRPEQATALADSLRSAIRGCGLAAIPLDGIEHAKTRVDLLVNATSATLHGDDEANRFAARLPFGLLRQGGHVIDLVYARGTEETPVVREAKARGIAATDGLEMLVQQGARAFAGWFGNAPVDVMRAALRNAVGR